MENGVMTKSKNPLIRFEDNTPLIEVEKFQKKLSEKPSKVDELNAVKYVPISTIETELDEDYAGLWQIENFHWQVVANEIVGSLELLVYHPVAHMWLRRVGSASVMIRQKKDADLTDIGAKIKNGLVMDFPKLQIACIKSAAKTLGAKYGRDLNRKFEDEYQTIYTDEIEGNEAVTAQSDELSRADTVDALMALWNSNPTLQNNQVFKRAFTTRRNELKLKK